MHCQRFAEQSCRRSFPFRAIRRTGTNRTIEIFQATVLALTPTWSIRRIAGSGLSETERGRAEKALRIVDGAAREIYFGSGAYGARNRQTDDENPVAGTPELRARLLREMKPTLTALAQVPIRRDPSSAGNFGSVHRGRPTTIFASLQTH